MCKATSILEKLYEATNIFYEERERLNKLLSAIDKEINKSYHDLEAREKLSGVDGYYVALGLQELLRKRRIVKQELYKLNAVNASVQFNQVASRFDNAKKGLSTIDRDNKNSYVHNWNLKLEDFDSEFNIH